MRLHLFLLFLLLSFSSFGQGIQFLDSTELVKNKRVRSMHISERMSGYERQDTSYFCSFDASGKPVEKYFNFYDEMPFREQTHYSENGHINQYLKTTATNDTLEFVQTNWPSKSKKVVYYTPVKGLTVAQENIVLNEQGDPIEVTRYAKDGKTIGKSTYSYSEDLKLLSIVRRNENNVKIYEIYNVYDYNSNLVESKTIEEKVFLQTLRKYNDDNQLTQLLKVDPNQDKQHKKSYSYVKGQCIRIEEHKNGEAISTTTFKYNSKGFLIERQTKWSEEDWSTFEYKYYKNGALKQETYISQHGATKDIQELKYSASGLILKELKKSSSKKEWEIVYTYLKNGLLELAVETHFQNDFERVTRYSYTYFK